MQAAVSNAKPASRVSRGACAPSLAVSGKEAQHSSWLLRARRAALVVVCLCINKGHQASERPLSFGACLWCDVPAASSNAKQAPRVTMRRRRACAPALAVSRDEAQHSSLLLRARRAALVAVGPCLGKSTAPASRLHSSARACGATFQLRAPTPSKRRASRDAGAPVRLRFLSLGRRRSTRAFYYCARAVPRWL